MIPVINDITRLLQAADSRYGNAYEPELQLSASSPGFIVALDATVTPASIVFIASRVGIGAGPVEFSTDTGVPLAVTGDVATLLPAAMVGPSCTVTVRQMWQGQQYVDRRTVLKTLAFDASKPAAPVGLAAAGALASIKLDWAATNNTNIGKVEVWRALSNNLAAAAAVGETAGLARTWTDNIGAAGAFYYWIRYISKANVPGPFNAQAGTLGTTGTAAEHLLELLKNEITESQLFGDLRKRIELVDAFADVPGSVAARVKAETDARVRALTQEAADRVTYVQGYTYSKEGIDESLSIQAETIASGYKSYADGVAVAAASDVRTYAYSRSNVDGALAAVAEDLRAEISSGGTASNAYVRNYAYSKAETNGAISASESTLRAEITSGKEASNAYVQNYAYSKVTVDGAFSSVYQDLTANYKNYADGVGVAANADVRTYSYSKSTVDGAFSSWAQQLRSEFAGTAGVSAAYVQNYTYSKAEANSAIASQTSDLRSTVGNYSTTIQQHTESIDGLRGQITVKIDNNGYVTGWGLASSYNNGVPTSAFVINAANFLVVAPGVVPKLMFSVGDINGAPTIGFGGALTAPYGTIGGLRIAAGGHLISGSYTGDYAWPTDGGGGWHLSDGGFLAGNPNNPARGFFQVEAYSGAVRAPGFTLVDRQLTLENTLIVTPKITNPNLQTSFGISLGNIMLTGQPNGSLTTGLQLTYSGGTAARHQWSVTQEGPGVELRGDPASANPILYAAGNTRWVYAWITCTAWSTTGAAASTSAYVRIQFGNAAEM